jgi:hypothetical protein
MPAPAELDDDVVRAYGAEHALDVLGGLRGEVRGAEDPHLLGLGEVRRPPRGHGPEPAPRDAHQRAGLDQAGQRGAHRGRGGAGVGERRGPVVEARRRRRQGRPEGRGGGWRGTRRHFFWLVVPAPTRGRIMVAKLGGCGAMDLRMDGVDGLLATRVVALRRIGELF